MPFALCDVNHDGRASSLDIVLLQRERLGQPHSLTAYGIQKGAAISPSSSGGGTTGLSGIDIIQLQRYILGYDPINEPKTSGQWFALADATLDGVLNSSDVSSSILPRGTAIFARDYSIRSNFDTELHATCALIDGNEDTYTPFEFNTWFYQL